MPVQKGMALAGTLIGEQFRTDRAMPMQYK
jgi:hypothetical protein